MLGRDLERLDPPLPRPVAMQERPAAGEPEGALRVVIDAVEPGVLGLHVDGIHRWWLHRFLFSRRAMSRGECITGRGLWGRLLPACWPARSAQRLYITCPQRAPG